LSKREDESWEEYRERQQPSEFWKTVAGIVAGVIVGFLQFLKAILQFVFSILSALAR